MDISRMILMIQSEEWSSFAQPLIRHARCSSSWHRQSKETSSRWVLVKFVLGIKYEWIMMFEGYFILSLHFHVTKPYSWLYVNFPSSQITLETDEDVVTEIKLKYFDTVPPATAMCVLKTGFLFVASEFGNHYLYQVSIYICYMTVITNIREHSIVYRNLLTLLHQSIYALYQLMWL